MPYLFLAFQQPSLPISHPAFLAAWVNPESAPNIDRYLYIKILSNY